jgi:hypothetical protein
MSDEAPPPLSDFVDPAVANAKQVRATRARDVNARAMVVAGILLMGGLVLVSWMLGKTPRSERMSGERAAVSAARMALQNELVGVQKMDVRLQKSKVFPEGTHYRLIGKVDRINRQGGPVREWWVVACFGTSADNVRAIEIANPNAAVMNGPCSGNIACVSCVSCAECGYCSAGRTCGVCLK